MDQHLDPYDTSPPEPHGEYYSEDDKEHRRSNDLPVRKLNTHDFTSVDTLHVPQTNIREASSAETLNVANANPLNCPRRTRAGA
jgi:hypothetical protein